MQGEMRNFAGGRFFLAGYGSLMRNDFDNLNLFQSEKQDSVNNDHRLTSKLA